MCVHIYIIHTHIYPKHYSRDLFFPVPILLTERVMEKSSLLFDISELLFPAFSFLTRPCNGDHESNRENTNHVFR